MSNFTYAISTYFANGLSLDQLNLEISSTLSLTSWTGTSVANGQITFNFSSAIVENNLTTVLENHHPVSTPFYLCYQNTGGWTAGNLLNYLSAYNAVSLSLDSYAFIGFNPIPTISAINTAIENYVEPPVITTVQVIKSSANNYLTCSVGDIIKSVNPQEIIVSQLGRGQFNTIAEAVASIAVGTIAVIKVYPGTYVENNPIIIPTGTTIRAEGSAVNTAIVGVVPTSPVFETGAGNFIDSFTIVGGSVGVQHNGSNPYSYSLVQNCIFSNNTTAISVSGGLGSLILSKVSIAFSNTNNSGNVGISISGGSVVIDDVELLGSLTSFAGAGVVITNGGLATIDVLSVYYCINAVQLNNGSTIKSSLLNIEGCVNGCVVIADTTTSPLSRFLIGTMNIESSISNDLNINANAVLEFLACHIDDNKISNTGGAVINSNIQNYSNNVSYQILSGDTYVGTESIPSSLTIGNKFNLNNMFVYLFDGINYVDESVNFRNPNNSPVSLTNQTIFICHKTATIGGFDLYSTLTTNPSVYFWNGSSWISLNFSLYGIGVGTITQINSATSIYFDTTYTPSQTTINGVLAYWIKVVPVNCSITSAVLHSNAVNFTSGQLRRYGTSRIAKTIQVPQIAVDSIIYFASPIDLDTSSAYTVNVYADSGITLNGQLYASTFASTKIYPNTSGLQSFTISASNIKSISAVYIAF